MRKYIALFLPIATLLLASCSSGTSSAKKAKEPAKPPEPVTGLVAFHKMFLAARNWSPDAQGMQLQSIALKSIPAQDGKYPAWRSTFVSEARRSARTFSYSVVEQEGLFKGVFGGPDENYSGPRGQTIPFIFQAFKIDSDAALKTSLTKAAEYVKKNPDKPVFFLMENNKRFPNPTWRVIWGDSVGTSNFSIFVDATSGDYLQTAH